MVTHLSSSAYFVSLLACHSGLYIVGTKVMRYIEQLDFGHLAFSCIILSSYMLWTLFISSTRMGVGESM
jgi:hypothetical protein